MTCPSRRCCRMLVATADWLELSIARLELGWFTEQDPVVSDPVGHPVEHVFGARRRRRKYGFHAIGVAQQSVGALGTGEAWRHAETPPEPVRDVAHRQPLGPGHVDDERWRRG